MLCYFFSSYTPILEPVGVVDFSALVGGKGFWRDGNSRLILEGSKLETFEDIVLNGLFGGGGYGIELSGFCSFCYQVAYYFY